MVALKVFTILAMHGESIFDENVTTLFRATNSFAELVESQSDFELATRPQSNIICFRYTPADGRVDLDELNRAVRARLIDVGAFYIVQTVLDQSTWLRCTVANPFTKREHFEELLESVRNIAAEETE
jgi:L-2,4-diaminobutyrate decarboxylase